MQRSTYDGCSGEEAADITYDVNPVLHPWQENTRIFKTYKDDLIAVAGVDLTLVLTASDYTVTIGSDGNCVMERLLDNVLYCSPPTEEPAQDRFSSRAGAHTVVVRVGLPGDYLKQEQIGHLQYYTSRWDEPWAVAVAITVCVLLMLVILLMALAVFIRRRYGSFSAFIHKQCGYDLAPAEDIELHQRPLLEQLDDDELKANIMDCLIEPHSRMKIGKEIGHGNFGTVYSGQFTHPGSEHTTACAIKTMRSTQIYYCIHLFLGI